MNSKNMLKRAFSVVLAGAMSVAVFTACDDKEDKKDSSSLSVKEMLIDVFDASINTDLISGVFSGEADTASKTEATIEFGEGITDVLDTEIKPISLTSETKLKGSNAGTDISVAYDGKNLVSLNGVYDDASKTTYVRVPELSDAYLSASSDDFEKLANQIISEELSGFETVAGMSLDSVVKKLVDFKIAEYEDIFNDYVDIIVASLPDATTEEDFTGSIGDIEYSYKAKTHTITADSAKKMVEAVFNKLENDDKIKEIVVDILGPALGITETDYTSSIEEARDELLDGIDDSFNSEDICLIYDGDKIVGINEEDVSVVLVDRQDAYAIGVEGDGINYSFVATADEGKIDIDYSCNIEDELSMSYNIDNLEIVDRENGLVSGEVEAIATINGSTIKCEGSDKAEPGKLNSEMSVYVDDVELEKISLKTEITNASDITVPSGTIYSLDQIEKYQSSLKIDEFTKNLQETLGEDLIAAITTSAEAASTSVLGTDDYYDDDYDYDDEDGIYLEDYYNDDGSFDYDKLKEYLGDDNYNEFMSQIDIEDLEVDLDDIEI